ncbi:hypothetical protein [Cereibacter ovatus]|uniref:hypothetical protein n=1 Tax=Cereibacter ovatus TaxID=439529 RepID=UPI0015969ACE|nr:hypothetical protein [Cereibacter ovatus]
MRLIADATAAAARKKGAEADEGAAKAEIMHMLQEVEVAIFPDGSKVRWRANAKGSSAATAQTHRGLRRSQAAA